MMAMNCSVAAHPRTRACSVSAGSAFPYSRSSGAVNAQLQLCSLQCHCQGRQALIKAHQVVKSREMLCGARHSGRDPELYGSLDSALQILQVHAPPAHRHLLTSDVDEVRSMHTGSLDGTHATVLSPSPDIELSG